jgi:aspartate ammonia-lyase
MGLLNAEELDEILSPENLMNPVYQGEYFTTDPDVVPVES